MELAEEKGIENGDRVMASSARGEIEAPAIVTRRFQPLMVGGKTIPECKTFLCNVRRA